MDYPSWLKQITYFGKGVQKSTMEEAMTHFFYSELCPWMRSFGYKWSTEESTIARKFLHFSYMIDTTSKMDYKFTICPPEPNHRNLEEDRDTFDFLVDAGSLYDFLKSVEYRDEIVGNRLDHFILEFCYAWVDVSSGKPGSMTKKLLDSNDEYDSDEELGSNLPDGNWSRRKHDLY
jgi:hypothetical protein